MDELPLLLFTSLASGDYDPAAPAIGFRWHDGGETLMRRDQFDAWCELSATEMRALGRLVGQSSRQFDPPITGLCPARGISDPVTEAVYRLRDRLLSIHVNAGEAEELIATIRSRMRR